MKVIIGADVAGFDLKQQVKAHLGERGEQILDVGMHDAETLIPYYEVAADAARKLQQGQAERAILFCGTGMGVAIVSNKFKGVYAGVVETEFGGLHARVINDCNVLTMGGWIVSAYRAKRIVDQWLDVPFTRGYEAISGFLQDALKQVARIEDEARE